MIQCNTCKLEHPKENFWKQKNKTSGYFGECKSCAKNRNNEWHTKNRPYATAKNTHITRKIRMQNPEKYLLKNIRGRAKERGLEFSLKLEDIKIPEFCPVLGIKLEMGLGKGVGMGIAEMDKRPSFDRIDNSKGYTPENIIVVSYRANRLKSDASAAELKKVSEFYSRLKNEGTTKDRPQEQVRKFQNNLS